MSAISDALQAMHEKDQTVQAIFEGKGAMQQAFVAIIQANAKIQSLVDNASFDGVDATLMVALGEAWNALQICQTTMQAPNIQEAINWIANDADVA